jgi:hypothetical protein
MRVTWAGPVVDGPAKAMPVPQPTARGLRKSSQMRMNARSRLSPLSASPGRHCRRHVAAALRPFIPLRRGSGWHLSAMACYSRTFPNKNPVAACGREKAFVEYVIVSNDVCAAREDGVLPSSEPSSEEDAVDTRGRAAFARRFASQPRMTFLTTWRIDLAADLRLEPGTTVASVAARSGTPGRPPSARHSNASEASAQHRTRSQTPVPATGTAPATTR